MEDGKQSHLKLVNSSADSNADELTLQLSETLRNLMGLLALPGLWIGRSGQAILKLTVEAIERTLPIKLIYSEVQLEPNTTYNSILWNQKFEDGNHLNPWEDDVNGIRYLHMQHGTPYELIFKGEKLNLIKLKLGYGSISGNIWLGSKKQDFPTLNDLAFIRAALTLAGTGIVTAKAQHDAEKANRVKDEFMAILGHELRNPLAPIMMSLDVLKIKNDGELPKELQTIDRQSKHLAQLVDDLLDISRITTGKIVLNNDLVTISEVINSAVENCAPLLNEKQHHLTKNLLIESEPCIQGDAYRLIQIFTNLINNAAKFMSDRGQIHIDSHISGHMIEVSIQDQGPGIPADLMPNLFTMFEQGKQTLERSKGGLGIGLAVVRNLVELHRGRVQVESIEGQGAKFSVLLPLAVSVTSMESQPVREEFTSSSKKILLVDDNVDGLSTLAEYLELSGYVVRTSTHPNDALILIRDFEPDIAILDIGLPGMTGYELATLIKQQISKATFLIALTGYGQEKDILKSKEAGFDIHLTKPISLDKLEDALTELDSLA